MQYKNISFIIFFFVNEVNFLAQCYDECCYEYFGCCIEKYKKVGENENDIKIDVQEYVNNAIKMDGKGYKPQTKVLEEFINHYKNSKEMLPEHLNPFLDTLLKIPISNEDLINIMKKKLDWETKKGELQYDEIEKIKILDEVPKNNVDNKSVEKYILKIDIDVIEGDLHRTYSTIESFNEAENLKIFKKIIYNFISQLCKSGNNNEYYQGMSFYAGFFLILCQEKDPSGKLAFELLYLFMTKEWPVNDYITGTVTRDKGTLENPNYVEEKYEKENYSIISFYMPDFIIIRLFNNKIFDNITFSSELIKRNIKEALISQSWLLGLRGLNISIIKKMFFLILLVKNFKIFFDIINFAVKVFPPPNSIDEGPFMSFYFYTFIPEFCKRYSE